MLQSIPFANIRRPLVFYVFRVYKKLCFFIVRKCSFFMGIIFCPSVVLVWTFNTRDIYNFISKEANIPVMVPFFNGVSFLFCRFLKSGVTNELKNLSFLKSKKIGYLLKTGQNFAVGRTLVWSAYVWRIAASTFFKKKSNIWVRWSFQSNSLYLKKWLCRENVFLY